ncbi:hypothetical protein V5799_014457 [Amblyomma americanum]|uniref:Secreted protein n=1 Tax=Amblyomma americanum TaxID=6943 RepID=A0AAQ4E2Z3_AMBAM
MLGLLLHARMWLPLAIIDAEDGSSAVRFKKRPVIETSCPLTRLSESLLRFRKAPSKQRCIETTPQPREQKRPGSR